MRPLLAFYASFIVLSVSCNNHVQRDYSAFQEMFLPIKLPYQVPANELRTLGQPTELKYSEIDNNLSRIFLGEDSTMFKCYSVARLDVESGDVLLYLKEDIHSGGINYSYCLSSFSKEGKKLDETTIGKYLSLPLEETVQSFIINSPDDIQTHEKSIAINPETGDSTVISERHARVKISADGRIEETR